MFLLKPYDFGVKDTLFSIYRCKVTFIINKKHKNFKENFALWLKIRQIKRLYEIFVTNQKICLYF